MLMINIHSVSKYLLNAICMTDIFKNRVHTSDYIHTSDLKEFTASKGVSKSENHSQTIMLSAIWKKGRTQAVCGGKKDTKVCLG